MEELPIAVQMKLREPCPGLSRGLARGISLEPVAGLRPMSQHSAVRFPQGLKPGVLGRLFGTAKAVPSQVREISRFCNGF